MKLRGLSTIQKLILNFLYEMRNTPMFPPDERISWLGIAQALDIHIKNLPVELNGLEREGFILSIRSEGKKFCRITTAGIHEVEKYTITTIEGELSTSRIGVKGRKEKTS